MATRDARKLGPDAQLELRRRAVALKKEGHTHEEIAQLLDVSEAAVRKWWTLFKRGGVRNLQLGQCGRRLGTVRTLSAHQDKALRRMITDRTPEQLKMPFALWTRQAVEQLIERIFGVKMPIRTVGEYLKRWGFTPQRPRKRAYEQQPAKVKQWLKEMYPAIEGRAKAEKAEIQWCDETGVSSQDHRGRGYAPQGQTPVVGTQGQRFSLSMISTVTNRGKLRFMIYRRGLRVGTFIQFLGRLTRSTKRKVFLIVDNLPVHRSRKVREWLEGKSRRIELFYLPPYSPELNPDEYLNNALKAQLRNNPAPRSSLDLHVNMHRCMRNNQRRVNFVRKLFHHPTVQYAA